MHRCIPWLRLCRPLAGKNKTFFATLFGRPLPLASGDNCPLTPLAPPLNSHSHIKIAEREYQRCKTKLSSYRMSTCARPLVPLRRPIPRSIYHCIRRARVWNGKQQTWRVVGLGAAPTDIQYATTATAGRLLTDYVGSHHEVDYRSR
jgi:hypothetical protein